MLRLSSTGTDSYQSPGARVSGLRPSEKLAFSLALERAGLKMSLAIFFLTDRFPEIHNNLFVPAGCTRRCNRLTDVPVSAGSSFRVEPVVGQNHQSKEIVGISITTSPQNAFANF